MDTDHIVIFDTTLRDGEQSPGATLNTDEKLEIATQLARLGVDVIEAGFPASSPGDLDAVQRVSRQVHGPSICGLARCIKSDIDAAWEAVKDAEKRRIHTFIATSDIHMEHQLRMTRPQVLQRAREMVGLCALAVRGHRVLAHGRLSVRPRFPVRGAGSSHRVRRDHAQHPGHGGL